MRGRQREQQQCQLGAELWIFMEWAVDVLMIEDAATPLAASSTAESTAVVGLARLMLLPADAQMTRLALSTSAAIGAAQSTGFSAYRLDCRF